MPLKLELGDVGHFVNYGIDVKNHLHHAYLLVVHVRVDSFLNLRLYRMINSKS